MALPSSAREHGRSKCSGDSNPTWITLLMSLGCIRNWVNWRSTWDHWRCGTRIRITRFHCTMEGLDTESSLSPTIWSHSVLRWREWLENLFNIYFPSNCSPSFKTPKRFSCTSYLVEEQSWWGYWGRNGCWWKSGTFTSRVCSRSTWPSWIATKDES